MKREKSRAKILRVMQIQPVKMSCLVAGGDTGPHEATHLSPQAGQQQARQPLTDLQVRKAKRKRTAKAQKAMATAEAGKADWTIYVSIVGSLQFSMGAILVRFVTG